MFANNHQKGDKISGKIKSITDFGIFIGLDGGIDGLIHLSDISWNEGAAEEAIRKYQKNDELETVILAIDAERERISLGLKQLADDPIGNYLNEHEKGSTVSGKVTEVDAKAATVELAPNVLGLLRASEISAEKTEDARTKLNVGDMIEAKITGTDRKTHMITLSMKAKDAAPKKPRAKKSEKETAAESPLKATLGDLLKAKMEQEGDV
jgi:small subunit ribosomal protein S1